MNSKDEIDLFKGKSQEENMEGKYQNTSEILNDNNKMKSYTSPKELKSDKNFISDKKLSDKKRKPNLKIINFAQHVVNSLFEYYARDIIYQLFNYHPMYYYNYKLTNQNDTKDKKIEANDIKEEKRNEALNIINTNNENSNSKQKNDGQSSINTNMNTPANIKNKDEKVPKKKKEKIKEILYNGDFDFVITNITFEEVNKVLNNKRISPFIFYGNIKENIKFDIIGEIKENIDEIKKNNEQINKYISLINLLRSDENTNEDTGLNFGNEKLMLYVFNTGYQKFLFKMLEIKKHYKQFETIDEKFQNENYKNIISIHRKFKDEAKDETNLDLLNVLINSSIPYFFIFIPSITSFISIIKKRKSKIVQLNSRITALENEMKEMKKQKNNNINNDDN